VTPTSAYDPSITTSTTFTSNTTGAVPTEPGTTEGINAANVVAGPLIPVAGLGLFAGDSRRRRRQRNARPRGGPRWP
jgi:hypothetical protein